MVNNVLTRYAISLVLLTLLVCGCTRNTGPDSANTPELSSAVPVNPAIATEGNTVSPTRMNTPIHLPTSTFTSKEKDTIISRLLLGDYLCDLPCWGGIEPGVTTIFNALNFLNTIAIYYPVHKSAEIEYQGKTYLIGIYSNNNTVEYLVIPWLDYSLTQFLQKYGKPDNIYLFILDSLPIDIDNPYSLFLFYKDQGIMVKYDGISPKGEILSLCLAEKMSYVDSSPVISLWEKGTKLEFQDVLSKYVDQYYGYSERAYYSLAELSDYSIDAFYEIFSDYETNKECLQVINPNGPP